jgi:hypothetical protein
MTIRAVAIAGVTLGVALAITVDAPVVAHRTAVSPYTFHRDILPIFESRCGRCHADGNVSGVALLRYPGARLVTWPIRQAVSRGHMPPWFAEGEPPFKAPPPLSARELNVLMTWATGGAPEGKPVPRAVIATAQSWPMGRPDVILPMPSRFMFESTQRERIHEVTLASDQLRGRMVRAVDLLPETPGIVRRAEIIARTGSLDQVVALWQPGDVAVPLEGNAAFRLDRAARVILRVHYRKQNPDVAGDRSQVGVYFAPRGSSPVQMIELGTDTTSYRFERQSRLVAIRPVSGASGASMQLSIVRADGVRRPLAQLVFRDNWARRYVFATPVTLTAGDRIDAVSKPSENALWTSLTGEQPPPSPPPVRVAVEFIR